MFIFFQFAGRRGVAGSMEWAGKGEGGREGDGGEEERPELDAEVENIFNCTILSFKKNGKIAGCFPNWLTLPTFGNLGLIY